MQILTCPAQLQRLEGILRKSLPLALPVMGTLVNITRGNPGQFEVLVDKWPDFGAVLARPSGEVAWGDTGGTLGSHRGVGDRGVGLQEEQDPLTSPSPGLQDGVTTVSQDLAGSKGVELDIPPLTPASPRLAPGVRVGSLQPSHVDLLNDTWPYGGNARSRRYLAEILGRFPHVCLQDGSGQPIAWVLTDHFGTGTHSYTLPEHRRHGHMQVALTVAAQRAQARGFPTFGHTALANRPMQQLQEMLGQCHHSWGWWHWRDRQ
uniref:Glycine N-acyltransferase-like protein n=1 Tax=Malurus cyaneus samueli TaxID=2593467 RepID=A0A8C5T743_9PASS